MNEMMERIEQIEKVAENNNGRISYTVVVDLLKDKNGNVSDEKIEQLLKELVESGITIEPYEKDEGYDALENTDPNMFLPADVKIGQQPMSIDIGIRRIRVS